MLFREIEDNVNETGFGRLRRRFVLLSDNITLNCDANIGIYEINAQ